MILTLSPNPAIDRILIVDEIVPGTTMRCSRMLDHVGGKGLDTSIALRCLGVETLGLGFAGGQNGRIMSDVLRALEVPHDLIWLEGETRIAHVIIETRHHRHSHLIGGSLPATPTDGEELLRRMRAHLPTAQWVVGGGSLPPGLPADFSSQIQATAAAAGVPTLFDMTGPPVRALIASRGGAPTVLKMNGDEFADTFGWQAETPVNEASIERIADEATRIVAKHVLPALVLTLGARGMLAITNEGCYHAVCPPQAARNAAGAGDAASAALAWRLSLHEPWETVLHWATAVSAASVLTELTAVVNPEDVQRLLGQTRVRKVAAQDKWEETS